MTDPGLAPRLPRRPICLAQPRLGVLTETFIDAHANGLPGPLVRLHGEPFPIWDGNGVPLASPLRGAPRTLVARALRVPPSRLDRVLVRLLGNSARDRTLARSLRRRRVRVVLAEYGPTGVAMNAPCQRAQIPMVVHFHGFDASEHAVIAEFGDRYRELFAHAGAVVAVSRAMRDQLLILGASSDRVELIPYGVDVNPSAPPCRPGERPATFVAVGRFVDKKAPHLTLLAFSQFATRHPDARLVMIGDGPLRETCLRMAESLRLRDRVRFPGPLSPAEVATALNSARCFVQHSVRPSCGDMEGTPVAILEAMAAGIPVVATRHGGIVDAVIDGSTGYLIDEGDVPAMAAAMERLCTSPDRAASFGRSGWRRALQEYRREDRLAELTTLLDRVVRTFSGARLPVSRPPRTAGE